MTDIGVPNDVARAYVAAFHKAYDTDDLPYMEAVAEGLRSALSAWVVPAPALHISERCAACGDVLHASVSSDNHYTLRQEKPE